MEVGAICEASCDGVLQDLQDTGGLWANCKKGPGGCKNQGTGAYQDMDRYEGGFKDGGLKNGHLHGKGTFTWLMGTSGTSMKVNGRMASNTAEALKPWPRTSSLSMKVCGRRASNQAAPS